MDYVTVALSSKWRTFVNSSWFQVIGACNGIAVTFCPIFLYQLGRESAASGRGVLYAVESVFGGPKAWALYVIIYSVGVFHMTMAGEVAKALYRPKGPLSPVIKLVSVDGDLFTFVLDDKRRIQVPKEWQESWLSATEDALLDWQRSSSGKSITWPQLGVTVRVLDLLRGYSEKQTSQTFWTRPLFTCKGEE